MPLTIVRFPGRTTAVPPVKVALSVRPWAMGSQSPAAEKAVITGGATTWTSSPRAALTPSGLVTVTVKWVSAVGATWTAWPLTRATAPGCSTAVPPVNVAVRLQVSPWVRMAGDAWKEVTRGAATSVQVAVPGSETVPAALVATQEIPRLPGTPAVKVICAVPWPAVTVPEVRVQVNVHPLWAGTEAARAIWPSVAWAAACTTGWIGGAATSTWAVRVTDLPLPVTVSV